VTRILFFMATSSSVGGVETWLDRFCERWAGSEFEVIVGLVRGSESHSPRRFRDFHPHLQVVEVDGAGLDCHGRVLALMRCIRSVRPDMVFPMGVVEAFEATIRCQQAGATVKLMARTQGNLPAMLADLRAYRNWVQMVICPGRLAMDMLVHWGGFQSERMRHVPNGSDRPVHFRVLPERSAPLRLGYVGRMTQGDKRSTDLIRFHQALTATETPFTLDIVGDGPCFQQIQSAIGNADNVTLHGALAHAEVYERVFPRLDVMMLFSTSESFGIVIPEAMMHGVVPVTSEFIGVYSERLNLHGETGLTFSVGDMQMAAQQIMKLHLDRALLKKLSTNGMKHAQRFTWEACLDGWGQALREAVAESPVKSPQPFIELSRPTPSRLTRLGMPSTVVDLLRRLRRLFFGTAVPPGGEEWPLFRRHYSEEELREIEMITRRIDQRAKVQHRQDPRQGIISTS